MENAKQQYDAVALLSGGLDSLLAVKVVEEQGLKVKCLHFVTPFFGKPSKVRHWEMVYDIDIEIVNISEDYVQMMIERPVHGFGKVLNPCVDCKIIMMRHARRLMAEYGAKFMISGEVVGQRPMSQRRDTLNVIRRDADVRDVLLRPLCAKRLDPTPVEESGLVDREKLLNISGRGRKDQLALAEKYGFTEIPTPAGGCKLAEKENARRYWPVLKYSPEPSVNDFKLSNIGRQYWSGNRWIVTGRNQMDNESLLRVKREPDLIFKMIGFPGPIGVGRQFAGQDWNEEEVQDAAAFFASFSPKARKAGHPVEVLVTCGEEEKLIAVTPTRETSMNWAEADWVEVKEEIRAEARAAQKA